MGSGEGQHRSRSILGLGKGQHRSMAAYKQSINIDFKEGQHRSRGAIWAMGKVSICPGENPGLW